MSANFGYEGRRQYGVILRLTTPTGTRMVVTNPLEAEHLIGSGYRLRVDRVGKNVKLNFKGKGVDELGDPRRHTNARAHRVIHATIVKDSPPVGL